jgi:hypothetical protein
MEFVPSVSFCTYFYGVDKAVADTMFLRPSAKRATTGSEVGIAQPLGVLHRQIGSNRINRWIRDRWMHYCQHIHDLDPS